MNETIRYGISSCYFLVPWNSQLSFSDFAKAIRAYSSDVRAAAVADALETAEGTVTRDWRGVRAKWVP